MPCTACYSLDVCVLFCMLWNQTHSTTQDDTEQDKTTNRKTGRGLQTYIKQNGDSAPKPIHYWIDSKTCMHFDRVCSLFQWTAANCCYLWRHDIWLPSIIFGWNLEVDDWWSVTAIYVIRSCRCFALILFYLSYLLIFSLALQITCNSGDLVSAVFSSSLKMVPAGRCEKVTS